MEYQRDRERERDSTIIMGTADRDIPGVRRYVYSTRVT